MDAHTIKVACSSCNLRELCLPMGLNADEMDKLDRVISTRKRIKRGQALFSVGDKFTSLYAVRSGFFKTCITTADGRDQARPIRRAPDTPLIITATRRIAPPTKVAGLAVSFRNHHTQSGASITSMLDNSASSAAGTTRLPSV